MNLPPSTPYNPTHSAPPGDAPPMIPCHEAVQFLSDTRGDAIVVNTMTPSRYWKDITNNPDYDLPIAGGMGKASSIALGLALSRPDKKIWCMDGDGSLLMNLGTLVTIAGQAPSNLVHFVFDDEAYQTTGGQPVPGAGIYDFKTIAQGAGYPRAYIFDDLEHFKTDLPTALQDDGPIMVVLKIDYSDGGPPFSMANTKAAVARLRSALAKDAE